MESTRLMKILYYLIQSDGKVTAKELSEYVEVSERTVKNDLIQVKEQASKYGFTLLAKKGKGYWIQVDNREAFKNLEDQLYYRFSHYNYTREYQDRANQVVRILLVREDYIKLDEIADRLFLSRSSIKNIMQEAREILEAFKLKVISKPGYGIRIEGNEINIRFCMLELFIDHDYRNVPGIKDEDYMAYFELNQVDIGEVRHHFLEVLRESGTRVVDNNTHRLVRYFFLMYNRYLRGHRLEFTEEDQNFLRSIGEYKTASNILKELEEQDTKISVDETEIFGLELLLLMWNDLNESDELAKRYPYFYQMARELTEKAMERIRKLWGIDFEEMAGMRQNLISAMIPNCTKIHFDFLGYNRIIGKKVENNMMSSSPVSMALALTMSEVIWEACGLKLSRADLFNYAVRFYIAAARIHYDYIPRRILISAQSGNQSGVIIRDKMVKKFGVEAFAKLEVVNSYEIRRLDQKDYDYMILNFAPYYYRYDLPVIYVDCIPDEKQMNQIYHQVVLGGYQLRNLQMQLWFDRDFVFEDFPYEGRESFLHLLAYKYCGSGDIKKMEQRLFQYSDICVWNGVAAIVIDHQLTKKNLFHLYCLAAPGVWEKKTIRYILFVSVNFRGEPKVMKYLEQLTHEMIRNQENLENLVATKSMNQFNEIVKHNLSSEGI